MNNLKKIKFSIVFIFIVLSSVDGQNDVISKRTNLWYNSTNEEIRLLKNEENSEKQRFILKLIEKYNEVSSNNLSFSGGMSLRESLLSFIFTNIEINDSFYIVEFFSGENQYFYLTSLNSKYEILRSNNQWRIVNSLEYNNEINNNFDDFESSIKYNNEPLSLLIVTVFNNFDVKSKIDVIGDKDDLKW